MGTSSGNVPMMEKYSLSAAGEDLKQNCLWMVKENHIKKLVKIDE